MTPCEKLGYKVGDRFVVLTDLFEEIHKGSVVTLVQDDGTDIPLVNNGRFIHLNLIKKIEEEKQMTKSNRYQFHSLSPDDIDFYRIAQDLNSSNPLALVDAGNDEQYVVVSYALSSKAYICGSVVIESPEDIFYQMDEHFQVVKLEHTTFADWIEWAKEVKNAQWVEKRKATVTVSLPKV